MTESAEMTCTVCGEAADESNSALCGECDQRFHLNPRSDIEGKDCGEVWIDDQYLSLRFACFKCLRGATPSGGQAEPPLGEAH